MSAVEIGALGFGCLTLLIYLGMHISTALLLVSYVGISLIRDDWSLAGHLLAQTATDALTKYEFGTAPLFVLMGLLVLAAGVGRDCFMIAERLLGRFHGGIGQATVAGNAIFAAVTGVSIAAVVMFTRMAVPEMLKRGYPARLAVGVVASSSMLGMLIPPSVLMIIYAVVTETSVGDMYKAGVVPGLILSLAFMVMVAWTMRRHAMGRAGASTPPSARPTSEGDNCTPPRSLWRMGLPIVALIGVVLGGMYAGWFTATEAGAVGAAGGLILAAARRVLTPRSFWTILMDTGYVTASIVLIIAAAAMFTRFLAISGLPSFLNGWIAEHQFALLAVVAVYVLLLLVLGTALDSVSTVLIAVPVFVPVFKELGADLIWIGIITMIAVEVGLITPPLGLSAFIVKGTLDADGLGRHVSLQDIYVGALPFCAAALAVIALLIAFPVLVTGVL
jgi:tripartite ATP-independent transporter DctM subunit